MTYIEFFDNVALRNACACLTREPDRVILLGTDGDAMNKYIEDFKKAFKARNFKTEFKFKTLPKANIETAVREISKIVEEYDDCAFDVTGGSEVHLLALGIVYERYPEKNIQIHRFNFNNNVISDCDKDGETIFGQTPSITVKENIRMYGGDILFGGVDEQKTYEWDMKPDFLRDIDLMWEKCRENVRYWNAQLGIFAAIKEVGRANADGTTTAYRGALEHYLSVHKAKYMKAPGIINYLLGNDLLTCFDDSDESRITIGYKNAQVERCLTTAGLALELKVYAAARDARDKDGRPIYNDSLNGVLIDWDGRLHDEDTEGIYDTVNEIDVLLMQGVVPIFVSCKNGDIKSEELYKLAAVTERFGGPHARKVLVTTAIDAMGEAGEYLRQRARDMNIKLVEIKKNMSDEEFARHIRNLHINSAPNAGPKVR